MTDTMHLGEISDIFFVYFKKIKVYVLLKWSVLCLCPLLHRTDSFFFKIIFQLEKDCFTVLCFYSPTTWISCNYIHYHLPGPPSTPLYRHPHPAPSGGLRAPGWATRAGSKWLDSPAPYTVSGINRAPGRCWTELLFKHGTSNRRILIVVVSEEGDWGSEWKDFIVYILVLHAFSLICLYFLWKIKMMRKKCSICMNFKLKTILYLWSDTE